MGDCNSLKIKNAKHTHITNEKKYEGFGGRPPVGGRPGAAPPLKSGPAGSSCCRFAVYNLVHKAVQQIDKNLQQIHSPQPTKSNRCSSSRSRGVQRERISPLDDELGVFANEVVLAEDEQRPGVRLTHAGQVKSGGPSRGAAQRV